ncbi:MAG: hypothetical protein QXN68_05840, partial [Thermoplasmata archaeon]
MKIFYLPIFNSISFFLLYFVGIFLNLYEFYIPLFIALIFIFAFGVILTYKIPSNISFIDVFQKLFLTFYVLAITIIIIFLFEFL